MTRLRRTLIVLGLVPFVLALGFAVKVGLMLAHDRDGRAALEAADPTTARAEFAANARLNVLESWVAPYDEGVARFELGDHTGAITLFSTALPLAPVDEVCRVRVNLALSHEAVGDAAADTARGLTGDALTTAESVAREAWARGRDVLATGVCLTGSAQEPKDPLAGSVDDRLKGKIADSEPDQPAAADQQDQEQGQGQSPREKRQEQELQERNDSGQQQRQRRQQARQERQDRQEQRDTGQVSGGRGNGGGQSGDDPGAPPAVSW